MFSEQREVFDVRKSRESDEVFTVLTGYCVKDQLRILGAAIQIVPIELNIEFSLPLPVSFQESSFITMTGRLQSDME